MLPANLISALQALTNSQKFKIAASVETPASIANLEVGKQFQATVQSKISEGLFKVQVAGQTLQMRLPGNIQSGDVIKLEVLATQPKITFSMVASTNPLSTPEQIGAISRMISNLADLPLEHAVTQQLGNKIVWQPGQPVADAKLLAGALLETLAKSGLFYESHQAQWIRGERSTNELLQEPQNVWMGKAISAESTGGIPYSQAPQKSQPEIAPQGSGANPGQVSSPTGTAGRSEQLATASNEIPAPVARDLLNLVQQQLHTLEYQHLVWMGQIWPGQQMQWTIQGEPKHHARQDEGQQWSTEIELALPKLGDVHFSLVFTESGLKLALHAINPATVELFNHALPQLKNSLADTGIPLISAVVAKS